MAQEPLIDITLYHNPRCSKSRCALELVRERGVEPNIIPYLDQPPERATLEALVRLTGVASVRELMRTKEDEYKVLNLASINDEQALLDALVAHPRLLERPIAVAGDKAVVARPPERVLELLP
ncbi:MAG: arsenate reductase (glutaredoxin) [Gammaproteobacteria bacterium]|nr:arsenate reductase (glutaredoxin) [Gammaproteobacteria bacterium]